MGIIEATYAELKQQELRRNPYSCLHKADIDINPHQVEAFTFALSSLEIGGAILADEVGLGKTVEAGLVIKYLLQSGRDKIVGLIYILIRRTEIRYAEARDDNMYRNSARTKET